MQMSKEVTYKLACFYYLHQRGGEKICLNIFVNTAAKGWRQISSATHTYAQVRTSAKKSAVNVVVADVVLSLLGSAVPGVQSVTARDL